MPVACLGTALTREQARLLARYADEVILSYDADGAGQEATRRAIGIFNEIGMKLRVLRLSGGKDPDEILRQYGPDRLRDLLEGAANDVEYRLLREREKFDVSIPDGKVSFLTAAIGVLAQVDSPIERDVYAGKLASELEVGKEAILSQLERALRSRRPDAGKNSDACRAANGCFSAKRSQPGAHPSPARSEGGRNADRHIDAQSGFFDKNRKPDNAGEFSHGFQPPRFRSRVRRDPGGAHTGARSTLRTLYPRGNGRHCGHSRTGRGNQQYRRRMRRLYKKCSFEEKS